jgi:hypothetical protein
MPVIKKGLENSLLTDIVLFGGDHLAALAFVQIRYWSSAAEGKTIPRHLYKNEYEGKNDWVYKSATDWFKELAMSSASISLALKVQVRSLSLSVVRCIGTQRRPRRSSWPLAWTMDRSADSST